ncbi:hypothetical protein PIIN_01450 [Serendipita indica DSM 11827]|uniref:Uncharacterized protein n=1 Tax=Serendipita indica (strain DSM 11827) TaxID=1109443 RepID=G4T8H9_SERID|nr:hypothetical protein PIIN_01450 [Serendipita indica DSM 11827]
MYTEHRYDWEKLNHSVTDKDEAYGSASRYLVCGLDPTQMDSAAYHTSNVASKFHCEYLSRDNLHSELISRTTGRICLSVKRQRLHTSTLIAGAVPNGCLYVLKLKTERSGEKSLIIRS